MNVRGSYIIFYILFLCKLLFLIVNMTFVFEFEEYYCLCQAWARKSHCNNFIFRKRYFQWNDCEDNMEWIVLNQYKVFKVGCSFLWYTKTSNVSFEFNVLAFIPKKRITNSHYEFYFHNCT